MMKKKIRKKKTSGKTNERKRNKKKTANGLSIGFREMCKWKISLFVWVTWHISNYVHIIYFDINLWMKRQPMKWTASSKLAQILIYMIHMLKHRQDFRQTWTLYWLSHFYVAGWEYVLLEHTTNTIQIKKNEIAPLHSTSFNRSQYRKINKPKWQETKSNRKKKFKKLWTNTN